jgi:hypothetical protein
VAVNPSRAFDAGTDGIVLGDDALPGIFPTTSPSTEGAAPTGSILLGATGPHVKRLGTAAKLITTLDPGSPVVGPHYVELVRDAQQYVTSVIIWTDVTKTKRIKDEVYIYTSGLVSSVLERSYQADGVTVASTTTTAVTRDSNGVATAGAVS